MALAMQLESEANGAIVLMHLCKQEGLCDGVKGNFFFDSDAKVWLREIGLAVEDSATDAVLTWPCAGVTGLMISVMGDIYWTSDASPADECALYHALGRQVCDSFCS